MENVADKQKVGLIAASKVTGADLYNARGDRVGTVDDLMIDKRSGTISYAIISFGGFLGLGADHYPLPWKALRYDMELGGYVTEISAPQLEGAPSYSKGEDPDWSDDYETRMRDYYRRDQFKGVMPFPNSF
jgi:sporulation protein YlmC with PRC-barrel domain